jgi:hypothetical protein
MPRAAYTQKCAKCEQPGENIILLIITSRFYVNITTQTLSESFSVSMPFW